MLCVIDGGSSSELDTFRHSRPLLLLPPPSSGLSRPVPSTSGQVLLGGHEDQRDFFVSGAEQRKHPLGELGRSGEAVYLRARLHVVEGHLTLVHVQEDAHLTELRRILHLHGRNIKVSL